MFLQYNPTWETLGNRTAYDPIDPLVTEIKVLENIVRHVIEIDPQVLAKRSKYVLGRIWFAFNTRCCSDDLVDDRIKLFEQIMSNQIFVAVVPDTKSMNDTPSEIDSEHIRFTAWRGSSRYVLFQPVMDVFFEVFSILRCIDRRRSFQWIHLYSPKL
nr:MAG TPA: hypothetical protein [Caudoviricetes sp.]